MPLIPLAEAQAHVLAACLPLPTVSLPLLDALGLVLRDDVRAGHPVPPFDNTGVDGFALQAADVANASTVEPVSLKIVGMQLAGLDLGFEVGAGEALRIMTGAPVPAGADAVVMVEATTAEGDVVAVRAAVASGANVRRAGEDVAAGDVVVAGGTRLSPAHLGVLATVGLTAVDVGRRPVVGVCSTGDELVTDGRALRPGEIHESNRPTLLARLRADGFDTVDLGTAADREDVIAETMEEGARRCDAVITSGGVSMGDVDLVKVVLDRLATMRWFQLDIKPAKPFAFGVLDRGRPVPVFGLPGNPVSSMVSYELLAHPGLRAMRGDADPLPAFVGAVAGEDLRRRSDAKTHFVRVSSTTDADGRRVVAPSGGQGSHQLRSLAAADALAVLPPGEGVAAGEPVRLLDLRV